MNCTWTLDAGAGNRVRLKTLTFDLQYTPSYVSCYGNDYLQIHNGDTQQSAILGSFCGRNNPYEVVSQGRYLYFTFWTNSKNFYNHAGITMDFQVFADDACPPEWSLLHSDKTCVKLMLNPNTGADWSDSQKYCGYSQSNLATYATQSVFDFVQGENRGRGYHKLQFMILNRYEKRFHEICFFWGFFSDEILSEFHDYNLFLK
ncbi:hypothetical protein FSP39_016883 [Pinctada imbricata]|uniref:CUB domain-containing protein n=1 Tax=Pinctada imbricata TaxID=66713 RepID=A0AA89BT23_PINIB|nr:hypothetical protein FSP39_016883 [Pinctada imbricata]